VDIDLKRSVDIDLVTNVDEEEDEYEAGSFHTSDYEELFEATRSDGGSEATRSDGGSEATRSPPLIPTNLVPNVDKEEVEYEACSVPTSYDEELFESKPLIPTNLATNVDEEEVKYEAGSFHTSDYEGLFEAARSDGGSEATRSMPLIPINLVPNVDEEEVSEKRSVDRFKSIEDYFVPVESSEPGSVDLNLVTHVDEEGDVIEAGATRVTPLIPTNLVPNVDKDVSSYKSSSDLEEVSEMRSWDGSLLFNTDGGGGSETYSVDLNLLTKPIIAVTNPITAVPNPTAAVTNPTAAVTNPTAAVPNPTTAKDLATNVDEEEVEYEAGSFHTLDYEESFEATRSTPLIPTNLATNVDEEEVEYEAGSFHTSDYE